ncbi:MAG: polysaccharide deacetylase family protein [Deltaproteobacteria bacterium]|nr:polysaccharide deacetylase family protein [Deltaproteobacteria bacterium]
MLKNNQIHSRVLLFEENSSWKSFLDSEGILWSLFDFYSDIYSFSILILSRKSYEKFKAVAQNVLARGGTVIVENGRGCIPSDSDCFSVSYPFHIASFSCLAGDRHPDSTIVSFNKIEKGTLVQLPFSLKDLWCDRRVDKRFIVVGEEKAPYIWETLPFVSKRNVRKVLVDVLWRALQAAGLPLVQKWYWPRGSKSFFCFRADMDAGNEESMRSYLKAVRPWVPSLSLFVCGSAYRTNEKLLQNVADLGAEIGNHTYTHYVYSTAEQNRANLQLTEQLLNRVGVTPKGFVGPASFWHSSMYQILQEEGYEYTSSFGVDHDNFPYFPPRKEGGTYNMLEIPFHCLGDRFPKFGLGMDSLAVKQFFDQLIEKKYQTSEPINIYGHPDMSGRMGDSPSLIEHICCKALSFDNITTGNMSDLASWWRKRHCAQALIKYDVSTKMLIAEDMQADPEVYWSIKIAEKGQYILSGEDLCKGISLDSLEHLPQMNLQSSAGIMVGEITDPPPSKWGLMQYIKDGRRSFRRKSRKIKELKSACNKEGWRKDE